MEKCDYNVFPESRSKDIFIWTKLVPGLSHNAVDYIQSRYFVLLFTLLGEMENK